VYFLYIFLEKQNKSATFVDEDDSRD